MKVQVGEGGLLATLHIGQFIKQARFMIWSFSAAYNKKVDKIFSLPFIIGYQNLNQRFKFTLEGGIYPSFKIF